MSIFTRGYNLHTCRHFSIHYQLANRLPKAGIFFRSYIIQYFAVLTGNMLAAE